MSTTLEIPEPLFERIKNNAIPFVDHSPLDVIQRWADHFEKAPLPGHTSSTTLPSPPSEISERILDPLAPPNLLHTRCRGTFGDTPFKKWNDLVRTAHTKAFAKAGSFENLLKITHAQLRRGNHSGDSGFHYVLEIGASIQGVDAKKAWEYSLHLARYLNTPISVRVEWRNKESAAFPGETGLLEWHP